MVRLLLEAFIFLAFLCSILTTGDVAYSSLCQQVRVSVFHDRPALLLHANDLSWASPVSASRAFGSICNIFSFVRLGSEREVGDASLPPRPTWLLCLILLLEVQQLRVGCEALPWPGLAGVTALYFR